MENLNEYLKNALRTDLSPEQYYLAKLRAGDSTRLLHAIFGLCTETGEIMDTMKRHIFYGTQIDTTNLKEEVGDIMWYVALLMDELKLTFGIECSEILEANIAKLRERYPIKFDENLAVNRNEVEELNAIKQIKTKNDISNEVSGGPINE